MFGVWLIIIGGFTLVTYPCYPCIAHQVARLHRHFKVSPLQEAFIVDVHTPEDMLDTVERID